MLLLTFHARHFSWKTFKRTLESVPDKEKEERVEQAVVVFAQAEGSDCEDRSRVFRHTLKHVKWLANKRDFKKVVLHSFTHLGSDSADPEFAQAFLEELRDRLVSTGYEVWCTPFGYLCEWELNVYGESLAKVWKRIGVSDDK